MTSFDAAQTQIFERTPHKTTRKLQELNTHYAWIVIKLSLSHYLHDLGHFKIHLLCVDSSFDKMVADRLFCFGCQLIRRMFHFKRNTVISFISLQRAWSMPELKGDGNTELINSRIETWLGTTMSFSWCNNNTKGKYINRKTNIDVMNWKRLQFIIS